MKLQRDSKIPDEIPTSSMADIAFLLIIFFMITASFAATEGLDFKLPEDDDSTPEIEPDEAVLIEIQPTGDLLVDAKPMRLEEVLDYLKPKLEVNTLKPVIIRPADTAPYGSMVDVFDELRQSQEKAGFEIKNISIPTQREIEAFWY